MWCQYNKITYISIYCSCKANGFFLCTVNSFLKSINNLFIGMHLIIEQHTIVSITLLSAEWNISDMLSMCIFPALGWFTKSVLCSRECARYYDKVTHGPHCSGTLLAGEEDWCWTFNSTSAGFYQEQDARAG